MKASVLIVEDSPEISRLVALYLAKDGIESFIADSAEEGIQILRDRVFDLVVLDLNLPGMDGFEFLTQLRQKSQVPVIILSARDQDEDMVLGLGLGGDEFVTKPFSPRVLVARCRALLRRNEGNRESEGRYVFHGIQLLPETRNLLVNGKKIGLTNKEFELLKFFLENPDRVFRPDEIFEKVWANEFGDLSTVAVYVQKLRKKIETDPSDPRILQTLRGSGYRFQRDGLP
jgi:two-component system response regulator RegX3